MASIHRSQPELMGWGIPKIIKSAARVVTAPIKGATHSILETSRGVATGDLSRIAAAPFKGVTHSVLEISRGAFSGIKSIIPGPSGTTVKSGYTTTKAPTAPLTANIGATVGTTPPPANAISTEEPKKSILAPALLIGSGVLAVILIAKGKA